MHVIKGRIPTKKNKYRIGQRNGKPIMYKSQVVKDYEQLFFYTIPAVLRNIHIDTEFTLIADIYTDSDIDGAVTTVLDCLEMTGTIVNDRLCTGLQVKKFTDKKDPRIEFKLTGGSNGKTEY